jgi:hypothetical protein
MPPEEVIAMLMLQLLISLFLTFGAGDALTIGTPAADEVNLEEDLMEYQRPPKRADPHPINDVTWGEIKGMYR